MGKIRSRMIKRVSKSILKANPNTFKKTFEENKKLLPDAADIKTKKLRNVIAGYITTLMKKENI